MPGAFDDHHPPAQDLLADCVHCGFCLPACPTYALWGEEPDSPRGRILLMDAALRGDLELTPELVRHWDACLGCMACVPACPSGVRYDRLIEQTRQQVERLAPRPLRQRLLRDAVFALFPHRRRMRTMGAVLALYRGSGLQRTLRERGAVARLPRALRAMETLAPVVSATALRARVPAVTAPAGPSRLRVALLTGCVQHGLYADVNAATARVLAAHGCTVLTPPRQGCCGALELHTGREATALRRARSLIAALEATGADVVAVNSAGCGSTMKDYGDLLGDDPAWRARASRLAARVRDVSEVLAGLEPLRDPHPLPMRLAYHDACHLAHAQGVRAQPREVLRRIPGLTLVDIPEGDMCCGSAGVYNLVQPEPAADLGRRKADHVRSVAPDALAAANPGCLVQIGAWLAATGDTLPSFHPVEILDASLRGVPAGDLLRRRRALQASAGTPRRRAATAASTAPT